MSREQSLEQALRETDCPRPCNGRPRGFSAGECFDAGECGCGVRVALEPAPKVTEEEVRQIQCERCQGNGEIVKDWDRYRRPHEGDVGDEAVGECPDCSGEGHTFPAHAEFKAIPPEYMERIIQEACDRLGYRLLAPGELDAETLEKAASYAKLWLEQWAADLTATRDAYIDAKKSGRMAGRKIEPELASAFAKQFHERADAVDNCAPSLAAAIRSLKGASDADR